MVDVEQQIKAWADAAAPPTGESVDAADVIEGRVGRAGVVVLADTAPRRRERWLAVAAAVLVIAVVGIGLAVQSRDDGSERLKAQHSPPASTSTPAPGFVGEVAFDVLGVASTSEDRIGQLAAAQSQGELDRLWSAAGLDEATGGMNGFHAPTIDFRRQVVVSITIPDDACPPTLAEFRRYNTTVEPRFVQPEGGCYQPLIPKTFVVALDWATTGDEFLLLLTELRPDDDEESLLVTRASQTKETNGGETEPAGEPAPGVTASLEVDATEVAVGDTLTGTITVVNDTGRPIDGTTCGDYFVGALGNDEYQQGIARKACLGPFTIPEGTAIYPIEVDATVSACTPVEVSVADSGPRCNADGSMPPMPPGEYQLKIDDPQHLVPAIDPVTVTVT